MSEFQRYAVYFTPPPGSALAEFGATWLGWDMDRGCARPHPDLLGLPRPAEAISEAPRKYGFHATLKPPMRLAEGTTLVGLQEALVRLSAHLAPVVLDGLQVSALGKFVALTPVGDMAALNALAASVVTALDVFRATPSPADLARRRAGGLTEAQDAMLMRWGYPYVLDAFRFHMTLSGKLPPAEVELLRQMLAAELSRIHPGPVPIDALTLAGEAADGQFHTIRRYALTGV